MPTAHSSRYRPTFTTARKSLDSGHIGRPWSATFYSGPGTDSAVGCLDSGNMMFDVEHKTKEECF